jgi:hypothetical protein
MKTDNLKDLFQRPVFVQFGGPLLSCVDSGKIDEQGNIIPQVGTAPSGRGGETSAAARVFAVGILAEFAEGLLVLTSQNEADGSVYKLVLRPEMIVAITIVSEPKVEEPRIVRPQLKVPGVS